MRQQRGLLIGGKVLGWALCGGAVHPQPGGGAAPRLGVALRVGEVDERLAAEPANPSYCTPAAINSKESLMRPFTVLASGGGYFEGPRWHDGRWYVSDLHRHAVFSYDEAGDEEVVVETTEKPSGIGWLPDGSMVFVTMDDHMLWQRTVDGAVAQYADLSEHCGGQLNDMVVDSSGRAFLGNHGFDPFAGDAPRTSGIIRVDPGGSSQVVADELWFPNGMVITPDGRTLLVGESGAGRYTAFTITADGRLIDRRIWAELSPAPVVGAWWDMIDALTVVPDGCCLDSEGAVWVATPKGSHALRIAEGGAVLEDLAAPDGHEVFACMLGGQNGRTLLLCCAPGLAAADEGTNSAILVTTTVDVPHAGHP
jgi:sugar lactone lactonase YvrE